MLPVGPKDWTRQLWPYQRAQIAQIRNESWTNQGAWQSSYTKEWI